MQDLNGKFSALNMQQYGINAAILFNHSSIDELINEYESTDDSVWCNGRGKEFMFNFIKRKLLQEDKFFDEHTNEAYVGNERWDNFCDDCVILSALGAHLYSNPIMLFHPQSYAECFENSPIKATNGEMPTLIEGIPILQ